MKSYPLYLRPPYNFALSAGFVLSFRSNAEAAEPVLRLGVRVKGKPVAVEIRPAPGSASRAAISSRPPRPASTILPIARWVLSDDLDLRPFYRLAQKHKVLGPLTRKLRGLKATRPASLLEMSTLVITEQQISLAAARSIQDRIIRRFGDKVEGTWVFPEAEVLAKASLRGLGRCGLSGRKAEYIRDFSRMALSGALDLDGLKKLPDDEVRRVLLGIRGWGPWSTEYFLIRGLARPDALPADDLGIRTIVGKYLGRGPRVTAAQVEHLLEPLRPFRGVAAFYLLARDMLMRG